MAGFYQDSPRLLVCILALAIPGYISMGFRLYTRITRSAWGADDWCMAYAALPLMVETISGISTAYIGLGQRQAGLSPLDLKNTLLWWHSMAFFYPNSMLPIRLGIAFQLCCVAKARKLYLHTVYGMMVANFLTLFVVFIFQLAQCKPIAFNWDKTIPGGHCLNQKYLMGISFGVSAVNITTDLGLAVLPVPLLWNVKINRRKTLSVCLFLGIGTGASCAALVRLKYLARLRDTTDFTFNLGTLACWTLAEPGMGFFVGNMATLRPLFKSLLNDRSTDDGYGSSTHGSNVVNSIDYYALQPKKSSQTGINGKNPRNSLSSFIASDGECQNPPRTGCIVVSHEIHVTHQVDLAEEEENVTVIF